MAVDLEYYGVPPADYREQELRNTITTTAGQTTISAPYSVGYVDVYFNGAKLDRFTEFTATDGSNIVLATAASAGDTVEVISRAQVQLANVYTQAQVNSLLVPYFGTATGTGDAQVLVTVPAFTSYVDGMDIKVRTAAQNTTTTPTINVNGLGAKTIASNNAGAAVYGKDWVAGSEITLRYNQTLGKFILLDGMTTAATLAQFDNSNQSATTAFVQSMLGNYAGYVQYNSAQAIARTDLGKYIYIGATGTYPLPDPTTLPPGTRVEVQSGSSAVGTITTPVGTFTGPSGNGTSSLTIPSAVSTSFVVAGTGVLGSGWIAAGGSLAGLSSSNGYQKMPNGLIFQWGVCTIPTSATVAVTYPIAFPTAVLENYATIVMGGTTPTSGWAACNIGTTTGCNVGAMSSAGTFVAGVTNARWLAIGY